MDIHEILGSTFYLATFTIFEKVFVVNITHYGLIIILMSIPMYYIYITTMLKREVPPPIAAWFLWLMLDVVVLVADFTRGIFNPQMAAYTAGTAIVCYYLVKLENCAWYEMWDKVWDTATAIVVVISIIIFFNVSDLRWALGASLFGLIVASMPLIWRLFNAANKPWEEPWKAWALIVVGSVIATLDGHFMTGMTLGGLQLFILSIILYWRARRAKRVV